jgi:hypothetical protein
MVEIRWSRGPHELRLRETWLLPLPEGVVYAEGEEMRRFLIATGNALIGKEVAVFGAADLAWFVVVSAPPGASQDDLEWTEESRESDGREVVLRSVLRSGSLFELVSEKTTAEPARRAMDRILAGLHEAPPAHSTWWPLLLIPFVLLFLIRRRRA